MTEGREAIRTILHQLAELERDVPDGPLGDQVMHTIQQARLAASRTLGELGAVRDDLGRLGR